ncbi:MAG: zinc ribbon domain-containing protein [Candidatus Thermoplasmatota archaeon]|nr:zinc ribbon domain-containing protein [Candidatus Thermoplasmatota archaeon]
MVKCKKCNREIPVASNFCPRCGSKLGLEARIKKWNPTQRKATNLAKTLQGLRLQRKGIKNEADVEKQIISLLADERGFRHRWGERSDVKPVYALGFKHGPDAEVRGIALEVKYATGSRHIQQAIGQGFLYHTQYPYVMLFLVDGTKSKKIKKSLDSKDAQRFVRKLKEMGLYLIVK